MYTPGPWKHKLPFRGIIGGHEVIAESGEFICQMSHYPSKEKQIQASIDATLIAAAPELLEALEEFIEDYEHASGSMDYNYGEFDLAKARAAIRKAKGE